jgi:hypothetical protein
MQNIQRTFLVALVMMSVCSCSIVADSGLTRSKAQKLIDSSESFTRLRQTNPLLSGVSITLSREEIECGIKDGLWVKDYTFNKMTGDLKLTSDGSAGINGFSNEQLVFKIPPKRHVVEVTGITDWPNSQGKQKYAKFTWAYDLDSFPEIVRTCLANKVKVAQTGGQAMFILYDDGWRLERVE